MKKITMNKNNILHILILFSIILFSACIKTVSPQSKQKKKAVFIFCDVTGSLMKPESEQVAELTADILDRLPSDSKYRLIPVHWDTGGAEAILPMNNSEKMSGDIKDSLKEARRNQIKAEIAKLYEDVNRPERKPERTCILSGLGRSRQFFSDLKDNAEKIQYEFELIFISDMLEHCTTTPAGQNMLVSIKDQKPADALQIIKGAPLPDLSPLRITIILPGKNETLVKGTSKMNVQTLNAFWSEIFKMCNNNITIDDWFTGEVPGRIFNPQS